ncbi:MAG: Asp-tRNA(Asn)/Glu-tRNA(Gln) amidotransferase subunit GatC [Saprospiraceae bacterium]|nr:Asp-tRNA(Asn)/Glu-tRNA(Gln) amidotransferase subunit GatC [Saprospiraceae bacterium]
MKIDEQLITKLETLSKLKLSDEERVQLQSELSAMIDMFAKISEVDTGNIPPLIHMTDSYNIMRKDVSVTDSGREDLMSNAPQSKNGFFAVPKVIE